MTGRASRPEIELGITCEAGRRGVAVGEAVAPGRMGAAVGEAVAPGRMEGTIGEAVAPDVEQAARLIKRSAPITPFEINLRGRANCPGSGLGGFVEGKIMEWGFYQKQQN
jgi:hypothetical protein